MAAEFGVDERQLQRVWQGYCAQRAFDNSPRTALDRIKMMPAAFPPEALEYFAALGLELFSRNCLHKIKEGQ